MSDFFSQLIWFPLVLTIGSFQFGLWCQKKWKTPLCNPILISVLLIIPVLLLLDFPVSLYQKGTDVISWFLTPATICLALPLYEQLQTLKKNLPAILTGILAGTATSLISILLLCKAFSLDLQLSVSLLPKSITTAMGMVLSEQNGGLAALTTAVIIVTGIFGNLTGSALCRLLHITDPIAQGVGFGTASHVVGTSRANEISPLAGAVSSLSLTVSGVLTALLFPLICLFL